MHTVGEEFFFFLKRTSGRARPSSYSKEHGRDRDKAVQRVLSRKEVDEWAADQSGPT